MIYVLLPAMIGILFITSAVCFLLLQYFLKYTSRKAFDIYLDFIQDEKLGPYYVSLAAKYDIAPPVDRHGAVVYRHHLTGSREWFHPIRNTHVALAYYEKYVHERDKIELERFLKLVDALAKHGVQLEDGSVIWYYPPYQKFEGQKVPWTSAMSQGQILGVLARAYQETGSQEYIDLAFRVLKSFENTIEDGGVRYEDTFGVFYEEFAFWENDHRYHTLNGMLSSLFGVFDLWKVTRDEKAREVFDTGVSTIRKNLKRYNFPFCSSYDLRHLVGDDELPEFDARYNAVHVAHLRILSRMTGDDYFESISDLWDEKLKSTKNRLRLTVWYARFKVRDVRREIHRFGVVDAFRSLAVRFIEKTRQQN
jgi:hypothetical protein